MVPGAYKTCSKSALISPTSGFLKVRNPRGGYLKKFNNNSDRLFSGEGGGGSITLRKVRHPDKSDLYIMCVLGWVDYNPPRIYPAPYDTFFLKMVFN